MRRIIVAINLTSRPHMNDIARGLAEASPGLEVFLIENRFYYSDYNLEDFDIIVTDRREFEKYNPKVIAMEGKGTGDFNYDYANNGQLLGKYATVSEILKTIVRAYERNNKLTFGGERAEGMQIISVSSLLGGSGVSAAAVTMGRQMAMNAGKSVLYMNMGGSRSWELYTHETEKPLRPARELPHMVENNLLYSLDSYVSSDKYGLKYLEGTEKAEILLDKLREMKSFDFVILDAPPPSLRIHFDRVCLIHNDKDVRTKYDAAKQGKAFAGKELIQIVNRSARTDCEEGVFRIPEDRDSFVPCEKGIEILMDGDYAARIGKVWEKWI